MTHAAGSSQSALVKSILQRIESIVEEAEKAVRPLELDPYRGQLFELFVTADGAGILDEDCDDGLAADQLTRKLAERWNLRDALSSATSGETSGFNKENMARMRLLWSLLRMWMEWSYAWQRWPEFHDTPAAQGS